MFLIYDVCCRVVEPGMGRRPFRFDVVALDGTLVSLAAGSELEMLEWIEARLLSYSCGPILWGAGARQSLNHRVFWCAAGAGTWRDHSGGRGGEDQ